MSGLKRSTAKRQNSTLEERAAHARQAWWSTTLQRASWSLVDSAFRFAVAEVNLEGLPVRSPDDMKKRAERLLIELRSQGQILRSADEIRYFHANAKRELHIAMVLAGKSPRHPAPAAQPESPPQDSMEAMGSLVARLLTQPGLDALGRLAETLSAIGGNAPFKADQLSLEAIDPVAQTITLSVSDTVEFQRICSALRQAEPAWGTYPDFDEEPQI